MLACKAMEPWMARVLLSVKFSAGLSLPWLSQVMLRHTAAPPVTDTAWPGVEKDCPSNTTLVVAVGGPAPPAPPEEALQLAVLPQLPELPTQ